MLLPGIRVFLEVLKVIFFFRTICLSLHHFHKHCTQNCVCCSDWCGSVGWVSSLRAKGCWFDSPLGHIPRLRDWSLVAACTRGNQSMFLTSVFLSISLSLPSPLSKINKLKKKLWMVGAVFRDAKSSQQKMFYSMGIIS